MRKLLAAMDEEGLTPEYRRFVDFYCQHLDGHKAVRQAFDRPRSLQSVINKPEVMEAISRRQKATSDRFKLSKEWLVQELVYVVGARRRDLFDEEGNSLPVPEWPDYLDAAIASVDFEDLMEKDEETGKRHKTGNVIKVRFNSKTEAGSLLMRHLGIDHMPSAEGRDRLKEVMAVFQAGPVPRETPAIEGEVTKKK
jgi:phage terminase small subunit